MYHRWPAMMEFLLSGSLPLIEFVICDMLWVIWQINLSLSSSAVTLARPPTHSLKITSRSFRWVSPHLWNQLPHSLRQPRLDLPIIESSLLHYPLMHLAIVIITTLYHPSPHSFFSTSKLFSFSNLNLHRHLTLLLDWFHGYLDLLTFFLVSFIVISFVFTRDSRNCYSAS